MLCHRISKKALKRSSQLSQNPFLKKKREALMVVSLNETLIIVLDDKIVLLNK